MEYLDLTEFKEERRIDFADKDALLTRLLNAAENYLGDPYNGVLHRPVVSQEFTEEFRRFEDVDLAYPDLAAITSVSHESAGVLVATDDIFDLKDGRLDLRYGEAWPTADKVVVTYTSGWQVADVPDQIKDAGYFVASQMFDHRDTFDSDRFRSVLAIMISGYRRAKP